MSREALSIMPPTPPYQPILSQLWTPLVAITAEANGLRSGQIAVSAHGASIVPDRPRVLVQLYKRNLTHDLVRDARAFALHLLRDDQLELAHTLGFVSGRDVPKLDTLRWSPGAETGAPVLEDCVGHLECRVINAMDGGDMTCFLADVVDGAMHVEGWDWSPLWWRDMRARMPAAWQAEWDAKMEKELAFSAPLFDNIDYSPFDPNRRST
jgi:flavin reductase (DIM6/NTAB) family NADH-FMN oxidoreductase RutF